jgi:hypothetical protein
LVILDFTNGATSMFFFSTGRSSTPKAFKVKTHHLIALRKVFYGTCDILVFGDEKGDASMRRKADPNYEVTAES